MGNVSATPPEAVWNGPTMRSLRASLRAGVVHTVCQPAACKYVMGSRAEEKDAAGGEVATKDFDETWYVAHYYDVKAGRERGLWRSGLEHFKRVGHREFRAQNEAEWNRWSDEDGSRATASVRGLQAVLTWTGQADIARDRIVLKFEARNAGLESWNIDAAHGDIVRAGARVYQRLTAIEGTTPHAEFRTDLPGPVAPGETRSIELDVPANSLPGGRSYVVVDLVCDKTKLWFSDTLTRPLILVVNRPPTGEMRFWMTGVTPPRPLQPGEDLPDLTE